MHTFYNGGSLGERKGNKKQYGVFIRRQSVDSLNGGFFTKDVCAVGRSINKKKKKSRCQYWDTILYVRMIEPGPKLS